MFEGLRKRARDVKEFDAMKEAEEITGKNYKDPETTALGFYLQSKQSETERVLMSELMDTHFGISWDEFLDIIKDYGFEVIEIRSFKHKRKADNEEPKFPKSLIAAHREKKLILFATSYIGGDKETINGGKVYGTVKRSKNCSLNKSFGLLSSFSIRGEKIYFSYEIRSGLISSLECISQVGEFVNWNDPEIFLWFLNYSEDDTADWEQKRDEFFDRAPDYVQKFVGYSFVGRTSVKYRHLKKEISYRFWRTPIGRIVFYFRFYQVRRS